MAKIKNLFFLTIPLWMIFIGCTSDMTYRLGDGYVYHNEGGALKRIYCTKAKCDVYIPPTILSYSYNSVPFPIKRGRRQGYLNNQTLPLYSAVKIRAAPKGRPKLRNPEHGRPVNPLKIS